jgi:hypothetical protein
MKAGYTSHWAVEISCEVKEKVLGAFRRNL